MSTALIGTGQAGTFLAWTGTDAFRLDEVAALTYEFDGARPTPEPGSLLLIAGGIVAEVIRRYWFPSV